MKTEQIQQFRDVKEYQRWSNYPTWCVKLWLDNDETAYNHWQTAAQYQKEQAPNRQQVKDGIWTVNEAARYELANQLKDVITREDVPDLGASMFGDLLGWALEYINWDEIAEALLEE